MKQYNVMLKPASSLCNLRCRYCFYCDVADLREVRSFGIMTDETMQNVLRSLEHVGCVPLCWRLFFPLF